MYVCVFVLAALLVADHTLPDNQLAKMCTMQDLVPVIDALANATKEHNAHLVGTSRPPTNLRCAVVGSSHRLLQEHRGMDIDGHDVIIRMNDAPTRGFERHVGSRTEVRLLHKDSASSMHNPQASMAEAVTLASAPPQLLLWLPPDPIDNINHVMIEIWRNASWARPHAIRVSCRRALNARSSRE